MSVPPASLATCEIERHSWSRFRTVRGPGHEVPRALHDLLGASSPEEVDLAYWKLENGVVVQGQLFEAAEPVVSVLLAALQDPLPSFVKFGIGELLFQIVAGEADESEVALGNGELGSRCREQARQGLWTLYRELWSGGLGGLAREILERIELDAVRLDTIIAHLKE
ncbi:hypothetical protein LAJ19_16695 (plasmid) [Deinococcus taeanensis]|uniref:hypothetical protein n=1 Tax=Deinococcus taeanensis TaxID=2737050 RepID=UPI001CDC7E95|nr:hypothetical protein [Deinococcus taeanensis]UBV44783.1 hypothetical protein LAJ19_16695 [Deinococcus taeanensis]